MIYAIVLIVCAWVAGWLADQIEGFKFAELEPSMGGVFDTWPVTVAVIILALILGATLLPPARTMWLSGPTWPFG